MCQNLKKPDRPHGNAPGPRTRKCPRKLHGLTPRTVAEAPRRLPTLPPILCSTESCESWRKRRSSRSKHSGGDPDSACARTRTLSNGRVCASEAREAMPPRPHVRHEEDWGFLFGDPLSTPGLASSYIQNLKAWARNIAPDTRIKKKPMDQAKIQSLLAEAALNSGRYCLRYAHFPVFSTWTPLTPVSRCLSVFLPVHGPAPPRQ